MALVNVIDRQGGRHEIEAAEEEALMHSLRDAGLPVAGTCGGHAACGSCHVYVERQWLGKLPPRDDPEAEMLDLLEAIDPDRSRLACQIRMLAGTGKPHTLSVP